MESLQKFDGKGKIAESWRKSANSSLTIQLHSKLILSGLALTVVMIVPMPTKENVEGTQQIESNSPQYMNNKKQFEIKLSLQKSILR